MKTDYTNARNAYDPKFIRFARISDNGMVDLFVRVSGTEDAPVTATFRDEFFWGAGGGGEGYHTFLRAMGGDDWFWGGNSGDYFWGGSGNDSVYADAGDDSLWGESGNDFIYGEYGDDRLWGGSGSDVLYGEDGDDHLRGGSGNDALRGGVGNDTLWGGIDDDNLAGGRDRDKFVFATGHGNDTITDFTRGEDVICLRRVDDGHLGVVDVPGAGGDDATRFPGEGGPQGFDALTITGTDEGDAVITWGTEDSILLEGVAHTALTAADFIFAAHHAPDEVEYNVITGTDASDTLTGSSGRDTVDGGVG